jgi:hypothetical protein
MTTFSGTWNSTISTPIGKMEVVFNITDDNGSIGGTSSNGEETVDILGAVADGDRLTWAQNVTKPRKLTLKFDVVVDGDTMAGTAKPGFLPAMKFQGSRSPENAVTTP